VACTPHAVVLDSELAIVYTGRIDDSRTGDGPRSRELEAAIEDIAAGRPVGISQTEAFGCSIIW
jgi:aromatic ring-opening dioxygenase LigB subunit